MAEKGGQEGNQNSTAEKRLVTNALRRAAVQNPEKLKKACEKLVDAAAEGDKVAFSMLADRLDGRPSQVVEGTGTDGAFIVKFESDDAETL